MKNDTRLNGTADLRNSYGKHNSGPREQMALQQAQQIVTSAKIGGVSTADISRTLTGHEVEMAKYTFSVTMPLDAKVRYIGTRFSIMTPTASKKLSNVKAPLIIIYQDMGMDSDGMYHVIEIPKFHKTHDVFGFEYVWTDAVRNMEVGSSIPAGTLLAHSPNVDPVTGMYRTGLALQIANLGIAAASEDGFLVSESTLKKGSPVAIGDRSCSWGKLNYPINTYGIGGTFQAFPKPGQSLRSDNLIFATRKLDPNLDMINMLPEALAEVDLICDEKVYAAESTKDAIVHDIKIFSSANETNRPTNTSDEMEKVANEFVRQNSKMCDDMINFYDETMTRTRGGALWSDELQTILVDCLADKPNHPSRLPHKNSKVQIRSGAIKRVTKRKALDEWFVEVSYHWQWQLGLGAKMSDNNGCKGVVVQILPDEQMPTLPNGLRADAVQFGSAIVARLIGGPEAERHVNGSAATLSSRVTEVMMGNKDYDKAIYLVKDWLSIIAHDHHRLFCELSYQEQCMEIDQIVIDGLYPFIPPDNEYMTADSMKLLNGEYAPYIGKARWCNYGNWEETHKPILIAEKCMSFLDKSSFKPMSSAVARQQHHGLPASNNKTTKVASQINEVSGRVYGETEHRELVSMIGAGPLTKATDLANNPDVIIDCIRKQVLEEKPSAYTNYVDRNVHPAGQPRNIQFVKHILECEGIEIV